MVAIGHHYLDNPKSLSNKVHKKVHSEQKKFVLLTYAR